MTATATHWLALLGATDAPLLPGTHAMYWWLCLGWGLVLSGLAVKAVARWSKRPLLLWGSASLAFAWAWIPGQLSPSHWLGLAFQMPSISLGLIAAMVAGQQLLRDHHSPVPPLGATQAMQPVRLLQATIGAALGWVLLLDTLALLPFQVYSWGFSPAVVGLALWVLLLPWVSFRRQPSDVLIWLAPLACFVFVALRLPTGNFWDALLDPVLWLALQAYLVREVVTTFRRKRLSVRRPFG
ncbi:MAG: hypothetical protein K9K38_06280 [Rhodoferax sp.]|nr:hypothetical protein [Rhodoferax sp.]MCF8208995.1 hypothetical protein [Rhodoferax sp.]